MQYFRTFYIVIDAEVSERKILCGMTYAYKQSVNYSNPV